MNVWIITSLLLLIIIILHIAYSMKHAADVDKNCEEY